MICLPDMKTFFSLSPWLLWLFFFLSLSFILESLCIEHCVSHARFVGATVSLARFVYFSFPSRFFFLCIRPRHGVSVCLLHSPSHQYPPSSFPFLFSSSSSSFCVCCGVLLFLSSPAHCCGYCRASNSRKRGRHFFFYPPVTQK